MSWPAQPNPSRLLGLGLFYVRWALPEVGSTHEKSNSGNFVLYILPVAPTSPTHSPPGCTKGQSKGRELWDSFLGWEGREGKLGPGSMDNWYYSFSSQYLLPLLTTSLMNICFSILSSGLQSDDVVERHLTLKWKGAEFTFYCKGVTGRRQVQDLTS